MTGRALRLAAWPLLALLVPGTASAFDWVARVGLLYNQNDTWAAPAPKMTQPRLDVDLRLDLRGDIGGPGIFGYGGSVDYRRTTTELNGRRTALADTLTYSVDASVLQHRQSPVGLTVFARRSDGRFESSLAQQIVGDRVTDTWGGTLRLAGAGTPGVDLGYAHTEYDELIAPAPPHTRTGDSFSARISHSTSGAFGIGASYRGERSDGTWVADQFDSHEADFTGSVFFGPDKDLVVVDRYYRRIPTASGLGRFALDTNTFRATLRLGRAPGESTSVAYSDQRSRTEATTSAESSANSLRYNQDFRLGGPHAFLRAIADVSATEQHSTAGSLRSRGATVGPELFWRRAIVTDRKLDPGVRESSLLELSAGPRAGVLAVEGARPRWGHGGVARVRANGPWRSHQLGAQYEVSYGSDLFGLPGWALDQQGSATLGGAAGTGRFNLQATLLARRGWNQVLGDEATRSFSLLGNYAWRRYSVFLQGTVSSGVLPGTGAFVGDGIVLPIGLSTQSTSASGGASVNLVSGLTARAGGTFSHTFLPGQPDLAIREGTAGLAYRYGAFELTLDERLTRTEDGRASVTQNTFFVRVSRAIGSRI